ncbi:hypothetical protein [Lentzea sp. NPDC059081]|uniref:hypothetical protein n=1 Tax=Lentzea sp. NPDC059081 TaxID=3346719 RepID=UPI00367D791C
MDWYDDQDLALLREVLPTAATVYDLFASDQRMVRFLDKWSAAAMSALGEAVRLSLFDQAYPEPPVLLTRWVEAGYVPMTETSLLVFAALQEDEPELAESLRAVSSYGDTAFVDVIARLEQDTDLVERWRLRYLDCVESVYGTEIGRFLEDCRRLAAPRTRRRTAPRGLATSFATVQVVTRQAKWEYNETWAGVRALLAGLPYELPGDETVAGYGDRVRKTGDPVEVGLGQGELTATLRCWRLHREVGYGVFVRLVPRQVAEVNKEALRSLDHRGDACWYVQFRDVVLMSRMPQDHRGVWSLLQAAAVAQDGVPASASLGTITRAKGRLGDFWRVTSMSDDYRRPFMVILRKEIGSSKSVKFD